MTVDLLKKMDVRPFLAWKVFPLLTGRYPLPVLSDWNAVFIHIPKNAGTSLQAGLGLDFTVDHLPARHYKKLLRFHFDSLFKFSFVRHPWDRFLSNYYYARMLESYYHSANGPSIYGKHLDYHLLENATILQCAQYLIEGKLQHGKSGPRPSHWDPQYLWLYDDAQKCLVDWIGRVENFESDLKTLSDRFGIEPKPVKLNVSQRPKNEQWSAEHAAAQKIIVEFYAKDFQLFGYDRTPMPSDRAGQFV